MKGAVKKVKKRIKSSAKKIKKQQIILASSLTTLIFGFTFFHNCGSANNPPATTGAIGASSSLTASNTSTTTSALTLTLSAFTVSPGGSVTASTSGGTAPYTYSSSSTLATVNGNVITAGNSTGTVTITVTDHTGLVSSTILTISSNMQFTLSPTTVASGGKVLLNATGGSSPYTYAVLSGGTNDGIDTAKNTYTAPPYPATIVLQATDSSGYSASATLTVTQTVPLSISPSPITMYTSSSVTLSASGGSGNYYFKLTSGGGSLSNSVYQSPNAPGKAVVTLYDTSNGDSTTVPITVIANQLNKSAYVNSYQHALLTAVVPQTSSLKPEFILAGAGGDSGCGQASYAFGFNVAGNSKWCFVWVRNVYYGDTNTFENDNSSTNGIGLANYNPKNTSPYTGTLTISGNDHTISIPFCFLNPNANGSSDPRIHLKNPDASPGLSYYPDTNHYNFTAPNGGYDSNTSIGGQTSQNLWIQWIASSSKPQITLSVVNGGHDSTIIDCSAYSAYQLSSSSNN